MDLFAIVGPPSAARPSALAAEAPSALFQINLFWVVVAAANFVVFLVLIWTFAFKPVSEDARRPPGAHRAGPARRRAGAAATARARRQERLAALTEARREANDILARAQKVAQETRDADIAATREELERMRVRATDEIAAEKQRALAELRGEVADLALQAAGRVVGETMTDQRQRRLVEEFLADPTPAQREDG